jgi:hypothetical protein
MANFGLKEDILKEIESLFEKMSRGILSVEELDELVLLTRELNERSVILRYKAFEEKVFGKSPEAEIIPEALVEVEMEEAIIEEKEPIPVSHPVFDFSLFEESNAEERVQSIEQEEEVLLEERIIEKVVEETPEEEVVQIVEETIIEETISATVQSNGDISLLLKRFTEVHQSMEIHMALSKLETLIGSFGLNERLQYINELFDGSSEKFGDAVKELDQLKSKDEAFLKAGEMALVNEWDKDSDTVADFIQKLSRRYA